MNHVRRESTTREDNGLVGNRADLPDGVCTAWCGAKANGEWFFVDASHAIETVARGSSVRPCRACVKAIKEALGGRR